MEIKTKYETLPVLKGSFIPTHGNILKGNKAFLIGCENKAVKEGLNVFSVIMDAINDPETKTCGPFLAVKSYMKAKGYDAKSEEYKDTLKKFKNALAGNTGNEYAALRVRIDELEAQGLIPAGINTTRRGRDVTFKLVTPPSSRKGKGNSKSLGKRDIREYLINNPDVLKELLAESLEKEANEAAIDVVA